MKLVFTRRPSEGFSLLELMVVIGIIIVLAGLMIAALPGVMAKVNRNKVEVLLAELESGLSRYQIDNGIFPQNPGSGGDRDTIGLRGAGVLYKHLSGDWDLDGKVDSKDDGSGADEKVYVDKLALDASEGSKAPKSMIAGGEYMVADPFGDPVRYIADPPNIEPSQRTTYNPTYDLWSIGGADPTATDAQAAHITNWQSN